MNYIISIINPDSLSILMDLCNQLELVRPCIIRFKFQFNHQASVVSKA